MPGVEGRIAPLSAAGIAINNAQGGGGTSFCSNKNNALNNVTPCKVGSLTKKGAKRKSPSRCLSGMVLHLLPPSLPLALRLMCSITPPLPPQSLRPSTIILQHMLSSSSLSPSLSPPFCMADCCVGLMSRMCHCCPHCLSDHRGCCGCCHCCCRHCTTLSSSYPQYLLIVDLPGYCCNGDHGGVPIPLLLFDGLVRCVALTVGASMLPLLGHPFVVASGPPPLQSRPSSYSATRGLAPLSSISWARHDVQLPMLPRRCRS